VVISGTASQRGGKVEAENAHSREQGSAAQGTNRKGQRAAETKIPRAKSAREIGCASRSVLRLAS